MQPCLGIREFAAYFEESDHTRTPIEEDYDAGLMVYDVFDLHDCSVRKKTSPRLSLFHAVMKQGVIEVPPYDDPRVLKTGGWRPVLKALYDYARRMNLMLPAGYAEKAIKAFVCLTGDGRFAGVRMDESETSSAAPISEALPTERTRAICWRKNTV